MTKAMTIQDKFLDAACRDRIPVTIFLISGFSIKGTVRSFDSFTLLIDCEGKQNLVYKHAITSIVPTRPVVFGDEEQA